MKEHSKHSDCRNYAPVDVTKGMCHQSKDTVAADGTACGDFDILPKCKHCLHYVKSEEFLGSCSAEKNHPMTYPDLAGITCEWFDRRRT